MFKPAQFLREHGIERIGDHGHGHIEVDLHQDRGGEGVEVEELHRFSDAGLHSPPAGVIAHHQLHRHVEVIGDKENRLLPAVPANHDLTDITLVAAQLDRGIVYQRVPVFALRVRNIDALPGTELLHGLDQVLPATPQRDELHPVAGVELGEFGIRGELRVEDERISSWISPSLPFSGISGSLRPDMSPL